MTQPAQPTSAAGQAAQAQAAAAAAYQAQQQQLRQQLLMALVAIWGAAAAAQAVTPNPLTVGRWVGQLMRINLAAQRISSTLTTAYLRTQLGRAEPIPVELSKVTGTALRGVDPQIVYARPYSELRWQLSKGKTLDEAERLGLRRLETISLTDLQLAKTHTVREVLTQPQLQQDVVGFRRVLSNNPNHCALCILASTQRYRSFDLMPIHPGCGCSVAPIIGTADPGHVLDPEIVANIHDIVERDLGQRYVDPGGRQGLAHYRDIIVTNTHGELGPVLGVRDHAFRGPEDIPTLGHVRVNPKEPEDG